MANEEPRQPPVSTIPENFQWGRPASPQEPSAAATPRLRPPSGRPHRREDVGGGSVASRSNASALSDRWEVQLSGRARSSASAVSKSVASARSNASALPVSIAESASRKSAGEELERKSAVPSMPASIAVSSPKGKDVSPPKSQPKGWFESEQREQTRIRYSGGVALSGHPGHNVWKGSNTMPTQPLGIPDCCPQPRQKGIYASTGAQEVGWSADSAKTCDWSRKRWWRGKPPRELSDFALAYRINAGKHPYDAPPFSSGGVAGGWSLV